MPVKLRKGWVLYPEHKEHKENPYLGKLKENFKIIVVAYNGTPGRSTV